MIEGVFVTGKLMGFVSESWNRNGKSGVNHRLGIARTYADKWGNEQIDVLQIDVAQEGVQKFQQQAAQLKEQPVLIRVVPLAKVGGRNGAFLTYFAPKESDLLPQNSTAFGLEGKK